MMKLLKSIWIVVVCNALGTAQPPQQDLKTEDLKTPDTFPRFAPLSPSEAESSFVVQDGFRMQLIAAEPLITDPVAMAYDENGRAYVVEMNDYPYTDKKSHAAWADNVTDRPIGKVRLLEDVDGDGKFDKSNVFVEGLSWPSGIVCSRGGVYITATPDVWYCKDNDGDGVADERRKVLTGFRKYNVQAIINNPIWGLDNRLYVAGSSNGGDIQSPIDSKRFSWRGDFRIDPQTEAFQPESGSGRFGNTFDDWGNRFICNIRNPVIQVVLNHQILARNPFYAAPKAMFDSAESGDQLPIYRISPVEPWRELRARQWSNDPTKKLPRSELTGGGVLTSTSGLTIYRGDQYGMSYSGQAFLGEVANNVIHRQTLVRDGVTFRAQRVDQGVEFVASVDTWFRPVNLVNAPDGTLHVLDMYREFIEHPWSIPDDIHERLDLESGRDRGRIYRLLPPKFSQTAPPRLGNATLQELVNALDDAKAWWRETAQRLLLERMEKQTIPLLETKFEDASIRGRIHILWTLAGLGGLSEPVLSKAMNDDASEVREQAIELVRLFPKNQSISKAVLALSQDSDKRVRFRTAIALGEINTPESCSSLAQLALRDGQDPWIRAAILSAPPAQTPSVIRNYLEMINKQTDVDREATWLREAMNIIGAEGEKKVIAALVLQVEASTKGNAASQRAFWDGLLSGLRRNGRTISQILGDQELDATQVVSKQLDEARKALNDSRTLAVDRLSAIEWLCQDEPNNSLPLLTKLLDDNPPQPIQIAIVNAISRFREPHAAELLLDRWRKYTPSVRESAFAAIMLRKERIQLLLDRVAKGEILPSTIDLSRKSQLLTSKDEAIQRRAKELLGDTSTTARRDVVKRYREALSLKGDSDRGKVLFAKHCAACHRREGQGVELGPNLETVRDWDADRILLNIYDPHREVTGQYLSYSVLLKDGRTLTGMIADETATSLTIKQKDIQSQTILHGEIEQVSTSGLSLMPNGLEEVLSLQDTADLIELLQGKGTLLVR